VARPGSRWIGVSGILYVALISIGDDRLAGESPGLDATRQEVARYLADAPGDTQQWIGHSIALIGVGFLIVFFGRLYSVLREGGGSRLAAVALVAGVVGAGIHVAVYAPFAALAIGKEPFDPEVARFAFTLSGAFFVLAWLPLAAALFAAAGAILQSKVLPRWFGWVTLGQAIVFVAGLFLLAVTLGGFVAYPLFWLWLILGSIVLIRRRPTASV
jgi:hypothetical protein